MAINRTQALVLGFFVLAWASLVVLFAAAPEVYGRALGLSSAEAPLPRGDHGVPRLAQHRRDPTLALGLLADLCGLPFRAASRSGVRVGPRRGALRGRTDLVCVVSGVARGAAVHHSLGHAGRLP